MLTCFYFIAETKVANNLQALGERIHESQEKHSKKGFEYKNSSDQSMWLVNNFETLKAQMAGLESNYLIC